MAINNTKPKKNKQKFQEYASIIVDMMQADGFTKTSVPKIFAEVNDEFFKRMENNDIETFEDLLKFYNTQYYTFKSLMQNDYFEIINKVLIKNKKPIGQYLTSLKFGSKIYRKHFWLSVFYHDNSDFKYHSYYLIFKIKDNKLKLKFEILDKIFKSAQEARKFLKSL